MQKVQKLVLRWKLFSKLILRTQSSIVVQEFLFTFWAAKTKNCISQFKVFARPINASSTNKKSDTARSKVKGYYIFEVQIK